MEYIGAEDGITDTHATTIQDLSKLIRKARLVAQLDYVQTQELVRLQSDNELLARLCRTMHETSAVLVDCVIAEGHKGEFCDNYSSIMNQADAVLEFVESRDKQLNLGFANKVSVRSRRALLSFLHKIRNDHIWVAERLSALTVSELEDLIPVSRLTSKQSSSLREKSTEENNIHKLQRGAPLNTFLFTIFGLPGAFDSEDELRLNLTATILHRLIRDNKTSSKGDKLCLTAFDHWSRLYGWEAEKSFEILLMDILQSGAKIIERAEIRALSKPQEYRSYYVSQSKKDDLEEEFFSVAVRDIFKLLNNADCGGLPSGALLLSKAVLERSADNDRRHYESYIIVNWFFYRFLSRAITHPEQFGLMNDYYISEVKRQKILFPLQQKIYSYCVPTPRPQSHKRNSFDEEIEGYVLNIFARFRTSGQDSSITLKAIEQNSMVSRNMSTFSVQASPSIFVCAADVYTLYTALCPFRRSPSPEIAHSALSRHKSTGSVSSIRSSSFKPARSSKIIFDIGSSFRDDGDFSEAAAEMEDTLGRRRSTSAIGTSTRPISEHGSDETLIDELRKAISDLVRNCDTGAESEAVSDSWEQLFVYPESVSLEDRYSSRELIENEAPDIVHTAVHHLVDNFEIDYAVIPDPLPASTAGYFSSQPCAGRPSFFHGRRASPSDSQSNSRLLQCLSVAAQRCFARRDYAASDIYHRAYNKLQRLAQSAQSLNDYSPILYGIGIEQSRLIEDCEKRSEDKMLLVAHANDRRARLLHVIDDKIHHLSKLRNKLWYTCDLRKSKVWNQAWEVVKCLYRMYSSTLSSDKGQLVLGASESANPFSIQSHRPNSQTRSNSRDRRFSRFTRDLRLNSNATNISSGIHATDQGIYDSLATLVEHGGPNKLSGMESQQTLEWMRDSDIHNFCIGEERLHRLCHEVDDLTHRILKTSNTSNNAIEADEALASALWNYDLFAYECNILKIRKTKQEVTLSDFKPGAISQDDTTIGLGSLLRRGSAGDLLSLTRTASRARGNSVGSLDNPRHRSRTVSCASPTEPSSDFMFPASPATTNGDSTSRKLHRQPSALSGTTSIDQINEYDEQAVLDFLLQTQLSLTSLLVSDFAEIVFSRGCETDEWCNDELTETSIVGKTDRESNLRHCQVDTNSFDIEEIVVNASEPQIPRRAPRLNTHHRTKSTNLSLYFSSSKAAGDNFFKSAPLPPSIDTGLQKNSSGIMIERTSSNESYLDIIAGSDISLTPMTPMRTSHGRISQLQVFPLTKAYKEILQRFSVHPSPYEKLRALYEFEILIVSNLSSDDHSSEGACTKIAPVMPHSPVVMLTKGNHAISPATMKQHTRKDSEDLARLRIEKLSITPGQYEIEPLTPVGRGTHSCAPPGTDLIVEEIQKVFRNPDLRPKTLFRDLQYIASFIPAHILNMTDEGKVFWDVGLAALGYKRESLDAMLDLALQVSHDSESILANGPDTKLDLQNNTLADAAKIYTICAKEGVVVGMRELAILQSTNSELVTTTIPPLSIASEIFAKVPGPRTLHDRTYAEIAKVEAAKRWFELAAAEGDQVSKRRLEVGFTGL